MTKLLLVYYQSESLLLKTSDALSADRLSGLVR